jgi:hypothetical protein
VIQEREPLTDNVFVFVTPSVVTPVTVTPPVMFVVGNPTVPVKVGLSIFALRFTFAVVAIFTPEI